MPGGLLFLIAMVFVHLDMLAESLPAVVNVYSYVVLGTGILIGWRFNRSRLIFPILFLALADSSLFHFVSGSEVSMGLGRIIYNAASILLPLNLAVFSLIKERGIVTIRGLWRMSLILLQASVVVHICRYHYFDICAYLEYSIIDTHLFSRTSMSQPALFTFGAAFIIIVIRFIMHRDAIESGFFWALISTFFALSNGWVEYHSTMYLTTASLILVVSVIETSHSMAFKDKLTGLPARQALDEALLKLEIEEGYTVSMLDIDYFKKFNDRYGHDVGDQVLHMVASKLSKVSGGGQAFRYGGEEFTIIFPGKFVDEVIPHLEQLRKELQLSNFLIRSRSRSRAKSQSSKAMKNSRKGVSITISIGVAEQNGRHKSPQQVVKAADKALYRAKKAGRNRVSA
ncbi:MAG: GGDEF domain-containing protein [bacterium]|nr:GGDEF domain-containing protein [bacterium]